MTEQRMRLDASTQSRFLKYLFKECLVRLGKPVEYRERNVHLSDLRATVERGEYTPNPIVALLSIPKGEGVPRFIPVFTWQDYAVYYAAVRAVDEQLAARIVPGTFGGWSLGGAARRSEQGRAEELLTAAPADISAPPSSYNQLAWVQNWNQFSKLLYGTFRDAPDNSYFVSFDIANFYDSIDLPRLERLLRDLAPGEAFSIEVLFFLLGSWNNRQTSYARSSKGLPQDIVGDCSRVLANGYLLPFDEAISQRSTQMGATYLRYVDDMVIAGKSRGDCQRLLYAAAEELNRLGLNLNVSKVHYMTKKEFEVYWGFEVTEALELDPQTGLQLLRDRWGSKGYGRQTTALRRALSILRKRPDLSADRKWVFQTVMSAPDQILSLNSRQMMALVEIADSPSHAFTALRSTIENGPYSGTKLELIRACERLQDVAGLKTRTRNALRDSRKSPLEPVRLAADRARFWLREVA
ncbi:MAG: RNA-directed DNA polymerase [Dehalococcoidia bacterium]